MIGSATFEEGQETQLGVTGDMTEGVYDITTGKPATDDPAMDRDALIAIADGLDSIATGLRELRDELSK